MIFTAVVLDNILVGSCPLPARFISSIQPDRC